jgi:hypothetical protein
MFGKILGFDSSKMFLENTKRVADTNYIGYHVVFPEVDHKIVGEIVSISPTEIVVYLIGEIINGVFTNGVLKKPSTNTQARIIFKSELECILGDQNYIDKSNILFGTSPIYKDYVITAKLNDFFANHFAIIGNTGSGKSCGLARIIQNIFYSSNSDLPKNAHFVLFDAYGEYYNTFNDMEKFPGLHFKKFTTQLDFGNATLFAIPTNFLGVDDLAILLGATDATQLPVLSKALDLVRIFKSNDPKAEEYKNDIIARAIIDMLSSGKSSNQMRDQIVSLLSSYNTPSLNLNSVIKQPGYDRTLRQCLNIDDQGKINAMNLVVEFIQSYIKVDASDISLDQNITYSLQDIYYALEFALINEGSYTNEMVYDRNNVLKSRLQSIINSDQVNYFTSDRYWTKEDFIKNFFSTADGTVQCQLVDVNLSFIEDRFAKNLVKIFSKLFFEFTTVNEPRGDYAIHILLEEAHRYVTADTDTEVLGYNIFDRITKEGRKYGVVLGLITQRPCELSKTALSQCSNFIVLRMYYPDDLNIIKSMSAAVTESNLNRIKTLRPGMAMVFGTAFKIPLICTFDLPNPMPQSTSVNIEDKWFVKK